jgi:hypothetical protein
MMPAELVSSRVFNDDDSIQKRGKLIRMVAAVRNT